VTPLRAIKQGVSARLPVALRLFGSHCPPGAFGVLMYHRIAPRIPGIAAPTHSVTPARFRTQLEGMLTRGFAPWSLRRALDTRRAGGAIPRGTFVVTFDDGYANNHRYAWPILRQLNIPATIFLATAYLDSDHPFPFDDWSAAGSAPAAELWRPLRTAECHEMYASGLIDFGSHTQTHADFRGRASDLIDDVQLSLDVLWSRFGMCDATFAFPYGCRGLAATELAFSSAARRTALRSQAAALQRMGVRCALTSDSRLVLPCSSPYDWGRFEVGATDTVETLVAKLEGWYSMARDAWHWLHRRGPGTGEG